jgi:hypothetical protein
MQIPAIFWDIASCDPYANRRFGRTYRLHPEAQLSPATCWFLARLSSTLRKEMIRSPKRRLRCGLVIWCDETATRYTLLDCMSSSGDTVPQHWGCAQPAVRLRHERATHREGTLTIEQRVHRRKTHTNVQQTTSPLWSLNYSHVTGGSYHAQVNGNLVSCLYTELWRQRWDVTIERNTS